MELIRRSSKLAEINMTKPHRVNEVRQAIRSSRVLELGVLLHMEKIKLQNRQNNIEMIQTKLPSIESPAILPPRCHTP